MGALEWRIRRAVARLKKNGKRGGLENEGCKKTSWKKCSGLSRRFPLSGDATDDATDDMDGGGGRGVI